MSALPADWIWDTGLQGQYAAEIGRGHVLHGAGGQVVARASGGDDVLVALPDGRHALVHLTFQRAWLFRRRWPSTTLFPDRAAALMALAAEALNHDEGGLA